MRSLIITLLFLAINILSFAQTPFTEQTFLDFCKKMEKDPVKTLKNGAVPDYVFVGTGGYVTDLKGLTGLYDYYTPISFTPTDYKIRTYGNSAIVTGRLKHTYTVKKTGAPRIVDELITYTYAWINGEWKLTSSQHSEAPYDKVLDNPEEIVKQWLTEYNKNTKAFFMDKCADDFIASNNGGKFFGKKVLEGIKDGQTADTEASDMKSIQSGNLAVVTGIMTYHHKQPDGRDLTDKNVFTFGMVKKNGKWMYATHHFSSMVEEKPEDVVKQFVTEYNKENTAFFMDRCPESFRYTDGEGKFSGFDALKSDKTHTSDSEVSDLKSFQSGNLAVVSGIHTWKDATMKVVRKVAFTYTMQKQKGKWIFAASHHTRVKE